MEREQLQEENEGSVWQTIFAKMGFGSAPLCLGDRARPEWAEDIGKCLHSGAPRPGILDDRCGQVVGPG